MTYALLFWALAQAHVESAGLPVFSQVGETSDVVEPLFAAGEDFEA